MPGVGARVVEVLAQQPGLRGDLAHALRDPARHLVVDVQGAQPAGHVGHVDPPAVQRVLADQARQQHRVVGFVHPLAQPGVGVVELGQGTHAQPAHVVVRVVDEVVEAGLRRVRVGPCGEEPLVPVAGVVGGDVAHHPQTQLTGPLDQPGQGRVAAQPRVDLVEGGGVVAVGGPGGEEGRHVQDLDAQLDQVLQAPAHPLQRAAEVLAGRQGAEPGGLVVPGAGQGPLGVFGRRLHPVVVPGEAVGEDLVDGGPGDPGGRVRRLEDPEVAVVGHLVIVRALLVQPGVAPIPDDREPVGGHHRKQGQVDAVDDHAVALRLDLGLHQTRFAVLHHAQVDPVRAAGDPYPETGVVFVEGHVVGGAVVVGVVAETHTGRSRDLGSKGIRIVARKRQCRESFYVFPLRTGGAPHRNTNRVRTFDIRDGRTSPVTVREQE